MFLRASNKGPWYMLSRTPIRMKVGHSYPCFPHRIGTPAALHASTAALATAESPQSIQSQDDHFCPWIFHDGCVARIPSSRFARNFGVVFHVDCKYALSLMAAERKASAGPFTDQGTWILRISIAASSVGVRSEPKRIPGQDQSFVQEWITNTEIRRVWYSDLTQRP